MIQKEMREKVKVCGLLMVLTMVVGRISGQNISAHLDKLLSETANHYLAAAFVANNSSYFQSEDCPPKFRFLNKPLMGGYFQSTEIQSLESRYIDLILREDCKRYFLLGALSDYYFLLADSLLAEAKLPTEYKFLMLTQSGLNPSFRQGIKSGLWGLSPVEAAKYGLWAESGLDERFLADKTTRAAVEHLAFLHEQLGGKPALVVLAFARGMLRLKQSGMETISKGWEQKLTSDEREYLAFFSAAVRIWQSLPLGNMRPALVSIQWNYVREKCDTIISLERVAEELKLDKSMFISLNRHLPTGTVNPRWSEGFIVLEKDRLSDFRQNLTEIKRIKAKPAPEVRIEENEIVHIVKSGEVLGAIARKYGVSVADIKDGNNLKSDIIQVGRKLVIYTNKKIIKDTETTVSSAPSEHIIYIVKSGDSLWEIAQKYEGVSPEEIMELNGISEDIRPGQKIKIPKK